MIAFLGLFGLSGFISERRTKEVGVRKVLGASTGGVVVLLIKQFIKWVVIANLVAWPLAWFGMQRWLEGFAYRAGITVWPFIYSVVLALAVSLFTVGYQALKAARSNPVEALRYEYTDYY